MYYIQLSFFCGGISDGYVIEQFTLKQYNLVIFHSF